MHRPRSTSDVAVVESTKPSTRRITQMTRHTTSRDPQRATTGLLLSVLLCASAASAPASAASPQASPALAPRLPIPLRLESADFSAPQLQEAVDIWRRRCTGALGVRLPDVVLTGPGVPIAVHRRPDSSSPNGRCGQTLLRLAKGRLVRAEIDIFIRQKNGVSCFPLTDEIAHELGHVFALKDTPWAPRGSIMGPRFPGERRAVSEEECTAATAWRQR